MKTIFLCVDIGTSRVKTALIDEVGITVDLESIPMSRVSSPDRQSAVAWYVAVAACIRNLLLRQSSAGICAIVLTGNMHALLGIDDSGEPVADAELWCSTSAVKEAEWLKNNYGDLILQRERNPVTPVFTLPKLIRMKNLTPELYRKTRCFLQVKDYIAYRLTGEFVTERTDASGTLLYRLDTGCWDEELASACGIDIRKFPPILDSHCVCGKVTRTAAMETGLSASLPVVIGSGDLASAALGSGTDKTTISLTLGTAGQILSVSKKNAVQNLNGRLFTFSYTDQEENLFLGSVPAGGFSFDWLAKNIMHCSIQEFFRLAGKASLTDKLPVFLPYLLGRGTPYMDYAPCAAWSGLSAAHTDSQICMGAILGVLCALKQSESLMCQLIRAHECVVLQALACREETVRKAACALFYGKKAIMENKEASLLGTAVIGGLAMGKFKDYSEAQETMLHISLLPSRPNDEICAVNEYFQRYEKAASDISCMP